jgi:type I restriction enzyme S subunit
MDSKDSALQGQAKLDVNEPERWISKKIEEVTQHKKGCAFKSEWFVTSGKPVVKVSDFTDDSIALGECLFLNEVKANDFKEFEICSDDIVIATVGSWPNNPASIVGKVVKAPKKVEGSLLNQNAVILRAKNSKMVNQVFLFYRLRNKDFSEYVVSGAQGSANQASITLKSIFSFEFSLPPIREQEIIAQILSDLDSKIELNRQMNNSLEAVGEAVFKRWFVDFEFPNEEGKPYKSSGGEMIESDNGEIPRDWVISSLDQLHHKNENCVITGPFGSNLHASDYRETGTPLILVKHVKDGRISDKDMPLVGKHKFPEMNRYILKIGDIVFTRVAVVGESAYIRKRNENWMISGQMLRVRTNTNMVNQRYLAQVFQQKIFKDQVSNYAVGSTRPSLNTKLLLSFKFVLPSLILQNRFSDLLENVDARIERNLNQIDILTTMRNLLLPKLMSGKIRVPSDNKMERQ